MASAPAEKHTYDYPRPALTVDVVLLSRDAPPRVLLIQRGRDPFAGQWAFPGGFVEPGETLVEAARRELLEETTLAAPELEQLYAAGDPGRDPRGWTISVAFWARADRKKLKPKAADDAAAAKWFALDDLPELAFDHAAILKRAEARLADRSA